MKSRARTLLDKSIAALLAAIEIYNKPDFLYRTDTFAILAVNAWELLLKARILQLDSNRLDSIIEYERRPLRKGATSKKLYKKKNRAGNYVTIGLFKAYDKLVNEYGDTIDPIVRENLAALVEIRDNSIHFTNVGVELAKRVQEIGTASLKNYLNVVRQWFAVDMSQYNFFIMPLAFVRDFHTAQGIPMSPQEQKLIDYIEILQHEAASDDPTKDFNLSLAIDIKFIRTASSSATTFQITNDPSAIPIRLEEPNIREKYPWTYQILTTRLKAKYADFKANGRYHTIRKVLERDSRYCTIRLLDPGNTKSIQKKFYNPNILQEFDNHYKKVATKPPPSS